jgi:hypothetical protein
LALASASAAILVAVQRTLSLAERAERNRATGSQWQRILNKATAALTYEDEQRQSAAVDDLEKLIDEVVANSPQIPERYFTKVGLDKVYAEFEQQALAVESSGGHIGDGVSSSTRISPE